MICIGFRWIVSPSFAFHHLSRDGASPPHKGHDVRWGRGSWEVGGGEGWGVEKGEVAALTGTVT